MLYREIIAVCSESHTKHINTLCGQNVELLNVELVVHIYMSQVLKSKKGNMLQCAIRRFVPGRCTNTAGRPQLAEQQHFLSFRLQLKRRC